jgi:hypothetical protein
MRSLPHGELESFHVLTLVLGGEISPMALREAARTAAAAIPGAEHRTLAGQIHNVAVKVLAPVLKEFFATQNADSLRVPSAS